LSALSFIKEIFCWGRTLAIAQAEDFSVLRVGWSALPRSR